MQKKWKGEISCLIAATIYNVAKNGSTWVVGGEFAGGSMTRFVKTG